MKMKNQGVLIIHKAVDSLQAITQINGDWQQKGVSTLVGILSLILTDEVLTYNVEIKGELKNHALSQIYLHK
jgi:hypothetical protein